jgi:hypothetical protein
MNGSGKVAEWRAFHESRWEIAMKIYPTEQRLSFSPNAK